MTLHDLGQIGKTAPAKPKPAGRAPSEWIPPPPCLHTPICATAHICRKVRTVEQGIKDGLCTEQAGWDLIARIKA